MDCHPVQGCGSVILLVLRKSGLRTYRNGATGDTCQSGEMVTLLNSLSFVFNISFLPRPNYRVKYYDYIVKWCSGRPIALICVYRWILT